MEASIYISHFRIVRVSVMTALRQILLIPLLVISVESIWPLPWLHNTFQRPQIRHQPLHLPPIFKLRKIPYNDVITLKSLVQDDISDFDVIIKGVTVKKHPRYDVNRGFSGIGPRRFIWINNIEEDFIESDESNSDDEDSYSGVDSFDVDDSSDIDGVNDISNVDDINDSSDVDNDADDANNNVDIDNDKEDDKNQDVLNTRPNVDTVSNVTETTNNKKPFTNDSKPNNADEDFRIDPRKDEEEIKKDVEK